MIPTSELLLVETFVVHGGCPDGLASAIVLDDILPGREIIHAVHKVTDIPVKPRMLFCDFCPPVEKADELRAAGAIVLDHHKGPKGQTENLIKSFPLHAFGDEKADRGVSGAVLAYRNVWKPLYDERLAKHPMHTSTQTGYYPETVAEFTRLIGIRDTWVKESPDWDKAGEMAETLLFYPLEYWIKVGDRGLLRKDRAREMAERRLVGAVAYKRKLDGSKRLAESAVYFDTATGVKVAIVPGRYVSDVADMVDADLTIGFSYACENEEPKLLLSTRSRGSYNCAAFCAYYGGGGHTNAAGCARDVKVSDGQPYFEIMKMVDTFEAQSAQQRDA